MRYLEKGVGYGPPGRFGLFNLTKQPPILAVQIRSKQYAPNHTVQEATSIYCYPIGFKTTAQATLTKYQSNYQLARLT